MSTPVPNEDNANTRKEFAKRAEELYEGLIKKEFEKILDTLETSPLQFPIEEDYNLPKGIYRKALFCKWYKALFMVQDQRVYLDVVLDCRQENSDL